MCSQTPDTTRPMANPARPEVTPPTNVASRKSPSTMPSMGRSQERSDQRLDDDASEGEAADVPDDRSILAKTAGAIAASYPTALSARFTIENFRWKPAAPPDASQPLFAFENRAVLPWIAMP